MPKARQILKTSLFVVFPTELRSRARTTERFQSCVPAGTESYLRQQSTPDSSEVSVTNSAMSSNEPNSFWKLFFANSKLLVQLVSTESRGMWDLGCL